MINTTHYFMTCGYKIAMKDGHQTLFRVPVMPVLRNRGDGLRD